jgi:hypothetical protein
MIDTEKTIRRAQLGDTDATLDLLRLLRPLLIRHSTVNNKYDEDLMQYLVVRFLSATKSFKL